MGTVPKYLIDKS